MKAATASNALVAVTALHSEVMSDVLAELEHYKNALDLLKKRVTELDATINELTARVRACGG